MRRSRKIGFWALEAEERGEPVQTLWTLVIVTVTRIDQPATALVTVPGLPSHEACLIAGRDAERKLRPLGGSTTIFICVEVVAPECPQPERPPPWK